MKILRRSSLAAGVAAIALALTLPAQAASAATTDTGTERAFHEIVSTLNISAAEKEQVESYFQTLPEAKQKAGVADPSTLFTYSAVTSTVKELPTAALKSRQITAAAATRTLEVTNKQEAKIANITVVTFNLTYRYEANGNTVTRNLLCTGSASGAINASSSSNQYISQGRGTCEVRTQASVFIKGAPFQFTKVHTVTTQAGNAARVDGRIYTA